MQALGQLCTGKVHPHEPCSWGSQKTLSSFGGGRCLGALAFRLQELEFVPQSISFMGVFVSNRRENMVRWVWKILR